MSNFLQRTLSGTVYVATVVATVLWAPEWVFCVLMLGVTVLAVREFHTLMHSQRWQRVVACVLAALMFGGISCLALTDVMPGEVLNDISLVAAVVYLLLLPLALVVELFTRADNPIHSWGNLFVGQLMVALPLSYMPMLLVTDRHLLLALFVLIWVNDSGAYCVGSLMAKRPGGNHKMFPRVSPNKSWEGLIGGILFALAAAMLMAWGSWFFRIALPGTGMLYLTAAIVALLVSVAGTLGDLMESIFKRTLGVKDSGRFLPGHGGVLDRFDSLLLATPVLALLVFLLTVLV